MARPHLLNLGIGLIMVYVCCVADQNADDIPDKPAGVVANMDIHGGVQMGVPNPNCDDGTSNIEIDYSHFVLKKVCRCMGGKNGKKHFKTLQNVRRYKGQAKEHPTGDPLLAKEECAANTQDPIHKCLNEAIVYDSSIPTSGTHRPLWPKFGEYLYLPPQRWIHSLEHGSIVFLYHPCADEAEVNQLRTVATSCLNKHIITPSDKLPLEYPFAVLSWGCKLLLPVVDEARIKDFMIRKALTAPETYQPDEGQFEVGLIHGVGLQQYETSGDTVCPSEPKSVPLTSVEESATQKSKCHDFMATAGVLVPSLTKIKGNRWKGRKKGRGGRKGQEWRDQMANPNSLPHARDRENMMEALLEKNRKKTGNKNKRKSKKQ